MLFSPTRSDIPGTQGMRVFGNRSLQWSTAVSCVEGEVESCVESISFAAPLIKNL